ncbi:MAG: hypothetical protein GY771_12205 [bacterium]|nr:hypothetical protein [bacterium]
MTILTEDIREQILKYAGEIAGAEGMDVFDLALAQVREVWQIRLVLDKLDGFVSVEDCVAVSRRLQTRIELEEVLPEDGYSIEVASPGLDRRLRGPDDYRRFTGQLAKFKVRAGEKPGYSVTGRIISIDDEEIGIKRNGDVVQLSLSDIKEARLVPEIPGYEEGKKRKKKKRK